LPLGFAICIDDVTPGPPTVTIAGSLTIALAANSGPEYALIHGHILGPTVPMALLLTDAGANPAGGPQISDVFFATR